MRNILATILVVLTLGGGCGGVPVDPPADWASITTNVPNGRPPECQQRHVLPDPVGNSGRALVTFTDRVLDSYAMLKKDYATCATWARGQR